MFLAITLTDFLGNASTITDGYPDENINGSTGGLVFYLREA